jgi:hypothetical protein
MGANYALRTDAWVLSVPRSSLENEFEPTSKPGPRPFWFLQLSEWEEEKADDEDPPICIHYRIEWRVTINN